MSNIITPELFESLNEQQELIVRHLYNQGELTASKIANIIQRSVLLLEKIERIRGNEYYIDTWIK